MRHKVTSRRRKVTGHRNPSENRHRGNDRRYLTLSAVAGLEPIGPQPAADGASLGLADDSPCGDVVLQGSGVGVSVGLLVGAVVVAGVQVGSLVGSPDGEVVGEVGVLVGDCVGVVGVVVGLVGVLVGLLGGGLSGGLVGFEVVGGVDVDVAGLFVGRGDVGVELVAAVGLELVGAVVGTVVGGAVVGGVDVGVDSRSSALPSSSGVSMMPGLSGMLTVSLLYDCIQRRTVDT